MTIPADVRHLRHPWERPVFIASAAANVLLGVAAVVIVLLGADWIAGHPLLARYIDRIRIIAVVAVLAAPAVHLLRRTRRVAFLGNSVRLSEEQMPEIHAILRHHCQRLGMSDVPELYLSGTAERCEAFSGGGHDYIVLGGPILEVPAGDARRDALAFALGAALGAIRLGHTRWVEEALLTYTVRAPVVRAPLLAVRTFSRDRYGALLAPEGLRGLLLSASGGNVLPEVDLDAYVRQVREFRGGLVWMATLWRDAPHISARVRALLDAGLLTRPVDRSQTHARSA